MISRKMLAVFGVAALAAVLAVAPASAKKGCGGLCKSNLEACVAAATAANDCTGLTGPDKKACKIALKKAKGDCKKQHRLDLKECKKADDATATTCSPSGAFLN